MTNKKRIFISHSSKDNEVARIIVDRLKREGHEVWYDENDLEYGQLRQKIDVAIPNCQIFMVLLSPDALSSLWVNREINAALTQEASGMLIVPALLRPCPIPPLLSGYKRLDFTQDRDPIIELQHFLHMIDSSYPAPLARNTSPALELQKSAASPIPTYSASNVFGGNVIQGEHISNISGNISGGTIHLGQENISNTNAHATPSLNPDKAKNDRLLSDFKTLIDKLEDIIDQGEAVDEPLNKSFIAMLAKIEASSIEIRPSLIERVRALSKRLGLMPLI